MPKSDSARKPKEEVTEAKPCLLKCQCICGNSKAGHVREMHRPNNFCPRDDGHAPGCPNCGGRIVRRKS